MANGYVLMRWSSPNQWSVLAPDGTAVSTCGTTTQGLQEAINYACENGYDLYVRGGGMKCDPGGARPWISAPGDDTSDIVCASPIVFPPMQLKTIVMDSVTVAATPDVTGAFVTFNSCMMVNFIFRGQFVGGASGGNTVVLRFNPTLGVPRDNLTTIVDSNFDVNTVAAGNVGQTLVQFAPTGGAIAGNAFRFREINGGGVSIQVTNEGTFAFNTIEAVHVHLSRSIGVQVGNGSGADVMANDWITYISPYSGVGLLTRAKGDKYTVAIHEGEANTTPTEGVKLEAEAARCLFSVLRNAATTPCNDQSTTKDNVGMHGSSRIAAQATLGNSAQTGIPTGTWTKLNLTGSSGFDFGDAFDDTNHRWTPGRPGIAHVSARVSWSSAADTQRLFTGVYVNGSVYRISIVRASGAGDAQGAMVDTLVNLTSASDYIEIFARQDTGSNRDVDGYVEWTWANFQMVG